MNMEAQKKRRCEEHFFTVHIVTLFSSYNLSLLKMWILLQHKTMEYAVTWDDRKAEKTDEIFKDREDNTEKKLFFSVHIVT